MPQHFDMDFYVDILTLFNFHQWKGDMEIQLHAIGLYQVTMDMEEETTHVIDKARFLNKKDEAFSFFCLSISKDLLFHLSGLNTMEDIWDHLASLYGKQDDLRVYQLENELMSLQPGNFETLNYFFTKFKHPVLLLK